MHDDIVIIGAARTPQGRARGSLAALTSVQLGTAAIAAALRSAGLSGEAVSHVLMGQVLQAGAGQNPAHQSARAAGIPWSVPAMTLNKVCLSGAVAVVDAYRMLRLGDADVVVAGGQESMTNAPHLLPGVRMGWAYGSVSALDSVAHDGLTDTTDAISMGESTERHVGRLGITRQEQDEVAAGSHQRAAAARAEGRFDAELAPLEVPARGGAVMVADDEGVRPDSTVETLGRLKPAFAADGTITAGNASPLSDGAAALVLARASWAREQGTTVLARVVDYGQVAGPDNSLHSQPSRAIARALERAGWRADELDHVEINEAFAAVALQSARDLSLDLSIVNPDGGAIALGHPIGASGARLTVHAAHSIAAGRARRAAIALCGGGGQGEAILLERA